MEFWVTATNAKAEVELTSDKWVKMNEETYIGFLNYIRMAK